MDKKTDFTPKWLLLKKKEVILSKLADILTANLIWDSNNGIPDQHKKDIKKLLNDYYTIIGDKNGGKQMPRLF